VLIGVDWGSSALRAFRFSADGEVVERRELTAGLMSIDGFEATLAGLVQDWTGNVRLLLCGMVGSRQGWVEAPYVSCPATAADLAAALTPVKTRLGDAAIAPGLKLETLESVDVMRGEETKVFGALDDDWEGVAVMPGTHAKWVKVSRGRIMEFRTWMTGELYALLRANGLIGALMEDGPHDGEAFASGVRRALDAPAITSLLFAARAEVLLGRLPPGAASSLVSGLLIGAEIAGGLARFGDEPIVLIGRPDLTGLYADGLAVAGRRSERTIDGASAVARGLWRLDALRQKMAT
jgi:2-dehydro-3-deoxygalactonokinase